MGRRWRAEHRTCGRLISHRLHQIKILLLWTIRGEWTTARATFKLNLLRSFKSVHGGNGTKFVYYLLSRVNIGLNNKLSGRCMKPVCSPIDVLLAIRAKTLLYFKFNSMKMVSTQENANTIPDKIYCCEAEKCMQSKLHY